MSAHNFMQDEYAHLKPNAYILASKYDVAVIEDERDLEYRPIVVRLSKQNPSCGLFAKLDDVSSKPIMLQAVVCDEYSLQGTASPISLRIKNGEEVMDGRITYNDRKYADVILPGFNHVALRTVFEPPPVRMALARLEFANWTLEQCGEGIGFEGQYNSSESNMVLCTECDDMGRPICPLGYLLDKQTKGGPVFGVMPRSRMSDDGVVRKYYVLPRSKGEAILLEFQRDARDPRPVVSTHTLTIDAFASENDNSNDFVLCMRLGVYYYTQLK